MQLQNLLQHKKGTSISVNGHVYKIGLDLVIRDDAGNAVDVPQIDADKLLCNPDAWRPLHVATAKHSRQEAKLGLKVVMSDGSQVAPAAVAITPALPPQVAVAPEKDIPTDPPIPKAGEDWADPSDAYSLEWLQACAKAYKVKVPKGKDKAALVEKIKDAMYE